MSAAAAYTFDADDRPEIPGATWADGHPGPAPNTPLPGLPVVTNSAYMPLDVHRRRTYESDDHGWTEVRSRRSKSGWRGSRKNKARIAQKLTLDDLISSLSGRSYLIV